MGGSWSSGVIFQQLGGCLWELWGLNPKLGSLFYSTRAGKDTRQYPSVKNSRVSLCQRETAGDTEGLWKGQCRKFHLQPFTLGSCVGRPEWTRNPWGDPGVGGFGERANETATSIPVLNHSPYCISHHSQAEHSSPSGISLRGSNSPVHRNYFASHCSD